MVNETDSGHSSSTRHKRTIKSKNHRCWYLVRPIFLPLSMASIQYGPCLLIGGGFVNQS